MNENLFNLICWLGEYDFLATWAMLAIGVIGLLFAWYAFNSKRMHDLRITYCVTYDFNAGSEPRISTLYIFNNKDKAEIITEIAVLFGGNVWLQLIDFQYDEAPVIGPYEMKKIELPPVSLYAHNAQIVTMDKVLQNRRRFRFIITTPTGQVRPIALKQQLFDTAFPQMLSKLGFLWIKPYDYSVNGKTCSYKVKYFGNVLLKDGKKAFFCIFDDGWLKFDGQPQYQFDTSEMTEANIKKVLRNIKRKNGTKLPIKTIEINKRHKSIDSSFINMSNPKLKNIPDVTPISRWRYFIIHPLAKAEIKINRWIQKWKKK